MERPYRLWYCKPGNPAYKLEISTDGQTFTALPSGNIKMNNAATPSSFYTADQLLSAVKKAWKKNPYRQLKEA